VDATDGVGAAGWKRRQWVESLAALDQNELWRRAHELQQAGARLAELAFGLSATAQALVDDIQAAHAAVEAAERRAGSGRFRGRGGAARRELEQALAAEQEVLRRAGFDSWLGFQLRRIDALVDPDTIEDTQAARAEWKRAFAAWHWLVPDTSVEEALAARVEIESVAVVDLEPGEGTPTQVLRSDVARA
jgi:hypothetical protein